jgi:hypothetical protein
MIRVRLLQFTARRLWDASDIARLFGKRLSNALVRAGDCAWQVSDRARGQ